MKKVLLDFQSAEITKLGIADIRRFDVNGKIYGFSEKEGGYEQLSVYQMGWE